MFSARRGALYGKRKSSAARTKTWYARAIFATQKHNFVWSLCLFRAAKLQKSLGGRKNEVLPARVELATLGL